MSSQDFSTGSCTVSVLNQTANVLPDGTWNVPNVPSNMGPVRARVTCVDEDGQTRSGASDFFTITPDRMNAIPRVELGSGAATPESVTLTLTADTLESVGATAASTVVAGFADGSSRDVTAAEGTVYATTNPAIATVSADGLVTAVASGRVLITVLHEAILDSAALTVLVSGDSDGDGMPDDFELARGLDPNDPVDAFEDLDRDGLVNGREFELGTDLLDADTDGDGIEDGEEVAPGDDGFTTDPLLADSDGDGVRDRLEVEFGTDPTDPASVDFGPILVRIEAAPGGFTLVNNTILPDEVSRRVRVDGHLVDGSVADLTARGTSYVSSDLTIANFGAEPGRIFAGADGTATVTASNNGFEATVEVRVVTFSPQALAVLRIPGFANGVDAGGGFAYVAAGVTGLQVVDVSDPAAPFIAGALDTPGNANDVRVRDGLVYLADGDQGLRIVDAGSPAAPFSLGAVDTPGVATDLALDGNLAVVADGASGVAVIDISDPAAPLRLGQVDTPGNARGVDAEGGFAVVADETGGVHVIDLSTPGMPFIAGSVHTRGTSSRAADVVVQGRRALVADGSNSTLGGLTTIDWSTPSTPVVVGATSNRFGLAGVDADRAVALAADYFFVNAVPVFDVRQVTPSIRGTVDFSRSPSFRDDNGNGVAVDSGLVFLVGARGTIRDNGTTGDTALHIGRFALLIDDFGIAPRVEITSPAPGAEVTERRQVLVTVEASDDILVESVELRVDGALVGQDFSPPFELPFTVPSGVPSLRLSAVARDLAGNEGFSDAVTVTVLPDTAPTVRLTSPVPGGRATEGATLSVAAVANDDQAVATVDFFVDGALAASRFAEPYRFELTVPSGVSELTLTAEVTDDAGQSAISEPVTIGVDPNQPPTVELVEPLDGAEVVEGATVRVVAGAADDVGVAVVRFFVDGGLVQEDPEAPFELELVVPLGISQVTVTAEAVDGLGASATSSPAVLVVIPDPGMTVEGRVVLDDGEPVAGAAVTALGLATTSASDGSFTLAEIPTVQGAFTVMATFEAAGGSFSGSSSPVEPLPRGTLDVGEIVLRQPSLVGYYDLSLDRGSPNQLGPILAAGLEAQDVGPLASADLSPFGILFVQNPSNGGYAFAFRNALPKLFDWIAAGGVLVFHDRHVSGAASVLPGSPGVFVRDFANGANIDIVDASTRVTDGPGGTLDDASLDGGNSSNHGFVRAETLPAGARGILSTGPADRLVLYAYGFGAGQVVYSTIPLDFYLAGFGPSGVSSRLRNVYAPNVLAWAQDLR